MHLRALPPAGTAIRAGDLARWLRQLPTHRIARDRLAGTLADHLSAVAVYPVSSGRAAMLLAFEFLARTDSQVPPARRELLLPGYTCPSVAAAAVRAGLRPKPVDVNPLTLDYDPAALEAADTSRAVGIVSANLFGIPNDLPLLESFSAQRGVALIDDAAQALGSMKNGRPAGSFGSLGVLSLDKGKNLTTIQGGAIVVHDDRFRRPLAEAVARLPEPGRSTSLELSIQLLGYAAFLRPWLYTLPERVLPLGETPWDVDFPVCRYPRVLAPMAERLFTRLHELSEGRRDRVGWYRSELAGRGKRAGIHIPGEDLVDEPGTRSVFPRLPVLLADRVTRDGVLKELRARRLGGSGFYPNAIRDVPEVLPHLAPDSDDTPGAREVAGRLLTLPTHAYVTRRDVSRIAEVVGSLA